MFVNFRRETVQFRMEIKSHPHISSPSKNWVQSLDCSEPAIVTRPENRSSEAATLPSLCEEVEAAEASNLLRFTVPHVSNLIWSYNSLLVPWALCQQKSRILHLRRRKESAKKLRIWRGGMQ